ncbi:hypothetical protein RSAG8_13067, partial [Rhizoctonia solani AG-8 WAC10335]
MGYWGQTNKFRHTRNKKLQDYECIHPSSARSIRLVKNFQKDNQ